MTKNIHEAEEIMQSFADQLQQAYGYIQWFKTAIYRMEDDLIRLRECGENMDKQINKVKKDTVKAEKSLKKGEKDISKLLKMDKKFDAKLEKCGAMKKKK